MKSAKLKKKEIEKARLSLHVPLEVEDHSYSNEELRYLLLEALVGISTAGMANKTRSKFVKQEVCKALGYEVPKTFKRTKPRFLSQNFDLIVQQRNNLQIWNEEVLPNRRYVFVLVNDEGHVYEIKILIGEELKVLDKTGTLTHKYQARLNELVGCPDIFSKSDSERLQPFLSATNPKKFSTRPSESPLTGEILSTAEIVKRLKSVINKEFINDGPNQDRVRGTIIHREVCRLLGYEFSDNGQFPDVLSQLLEVKLQTSPTIDLGLVLPTDETTLLKLEGTEIRNCDVRYIVFEAEVTEKGFLVKNFAIGTGADFFTRFRQFGGKVKNSKIQIPLPKSFFEKV
ncbi:restriction endonuclease [Peredibacter sp. HCB2-198]|uniref:restriction endonuclease n=1 Tax=Peredibacter sp. HCB2-198 TaxID=3383025 RepID=UPI0038B67323